MGHQFMAGQLTSLKGMLAVKMMIYHEKQTVEPCLG